MQCKISGCDREAMYPGKQLCQMHYFRFMRNGTFDLQAKSRKYRLQNPAGYQRVYEPNHALAGSDGYVYEHRKIVFDHYGKRIPDCEICGNPTNWETCHIDHRDEDVTNNHRDNLRPVCRGCNTGRTERATIKKYEIDGRVMSLTEWAKEPGVQVCRAQVAVRMARGMDLKSALFSKNITHPKQS